jgi:hypothetical protein
MSNWGKMLEDDLSWREAELASLKLLVADAAAGSTRHTSLLRALWALLYAHYEGFFKFAWDLYLGALNDARITREDATEALARFSLSKNFRELRQDLSNKSLWSCFASNFAAWMKEELRFEVGLETQHNLWPNVARENSMEVGLPCSKIDEFQVELRALVSRRNDIAHGKKMVIKTLEEYQKYEKAAVLAMHELAIAVLEALDHKWYLKPASALPPPS